MQCSKTDTSLDVSAVISDNKQLTLKTNNPCMVLTDDGVTITTVRRHTSLDLRVMNTAASFQSLQTLTKHHSTQ